MIRGRRACALSLFVALALSMWTPVNAQQTIRIATYNVSLFGKEVGEVVDRLRTKRDPQASKIAAIVQTIRPDVLLLNEIDYDQDGSAIDLLNENYFAISQFGKPGINYPYRYAIPSNTGIGSNVDLNGNGLSSDPDDSWGYGTYPGQYAMAVASRFPFDASQIRSFQAYLWRDLPNAMRPHDPAEQTSYYTDHAWNQLRLSSKNHVDVPIQVGDRRLHLLASHPTPPVFDGPADHNGCRNHDEIRFWTDYLEPESLHLTDDRGVRGGLRPEALFVVAGDLNSDPRAGDSRRDAIRSLLSHPRVHDPDPISLGASEATAKSKANATAAFGGGRFMRIDYVLPSREFKVRKAGVFWPSKGNADHNLIDASDHRMVWVEVELP
ncbi:MAG: endonuclease/exonuclease/phosphatase family protein [Rubripirellula sp.]